VLAFKNLEIATLDLLGPIGGAVQTAMQKVPAMKGKKLATIGKLTGGTSFEPFKAITQFLGGKLELTEPVEVNTSAGKLKIGGAAGLDAGIDLEGTLQLAPDVVAKMTGGKVEPKQAIPVPLTIGGTWDKPKVDGIDASKIVEAIVRELTGETIDRAKDAAVDAAKDVVTDAAKGDVKGAVKDAKDAAKGAAKDAKDKGKDAVKDVLGLGGKDDEKDKKSNEKDKKDKKKSAADRASDAAKGILGR
jgi:hypothetical protein